ncbi:MAG TPA: hypothetical protein VIK89_10040, partial [Cytophagaceae bacterium]
MKNNYVTSFILLISLITCNAQNFSLEYKKEFHSNGHKKCEYFIRNNKKDSSYLEWNQKGELVVKGYYKNGQKHGLWISYDLGLPNPNDSVVEIYNYDTLVRYHKIIGNPWDGVKKSEEIIVYDSGSRYDTLRNWWDYNKNILNWEFTLKNNKVNGIARYYYENGQPWKETESFEGMDHGRSIE